MSLEKLNDLKNDIPKVDDNLNNKIYSKFNKEKKVSFFYIHKKFILSLSALLIVIIGIVTTTILFNNNDDVEEYIYKEPTLLLQAKDLEEYEIFSIDTNFENKIKSFSCELSEKYIKEYNENTNNIAISPLSIYMVLAMLAECSNEAAREEILNAIGITYDEMVLYTESLMEYYNKQYKYEQSYKLILDNSMWFNYDLPLNHNKLYDLSDKYYCSSYNVDFFNDNRSANQGIREHIKEKTNNLIDLEPNISKDTLLTLINTLYLNSVWDIKDLKLTEDKKEFKNADGTVTNVNFIDGNYTYGQVYETDTFKHFYISTYATHKLKFILPKDDYSIEDVFTKENLNTINSISDYKSEDLINWVRYKTKCIFPEFTASTDKNINDLLKDEFNINKVFNISENPLSVTNIPTACGEIRHVTNLNVNKKGIEGAALTLDQLAMSPAPMTEINIDFVVDRPFGYIITDYKNNILFSGVVNKI